MKKILVTKTEEFTRLLAKSDLTTFLAILKILCVPQQRKEDTDLRPFEDLWAEAIENFDNLKRSQKKELIKLLRAVVS